MDGSTDEPVVDLTAAQERLYGLDLGEFTAGRKALATAARSAGNRDLAARIEALRAPTAAAWALNQLVRARPEQADALRRTAEMLRAAQARLDAGELRSLRPHRDALLESVVATTATVAATRGRALSPAVRAEVRNTLVAALADEGAQVAVLSGHLVKPLRYAGLGEVSADGEGTGDAADRATAHPVAPPAHPAVAGRSRSVRREEERRQEAAAAHQRRVRAARDRLGAADQALATASLVEAEARRRVEAGRRRIEEFEALLASARADLEVIKGAADAAEQSRAAAAAALEAAQATLNALQEEPD